MRIFVSVKNVSLLLAVVFALTACKTAQERADEHYQSGLELLESGDVDRAILEFRNVFQLDATHREARQMLGQVFLEEKGDKRRAYRQFLRIAEQFPDDLDTRVKLAEIAVSIGSIDEVNRHGAHAETLAPEDPRVQAIKLLRSYNDMSRSDDEAARREVLRQADEMLKDQPDSIFLRVVRVDGAVRENNFADALSDIDWMLERDPDNQQILSQRLNVLAQLGDMDKVEAQLKDMIARFPDNDAHKATLIRFYLSREDLDSAEAFLRERAADAQDISMRMDLIRFLMELRGTDVAREELRVAVSEAENPVPFQLLLAALDFEEGNQQEAIAALEGLVRDAEDPAQVLDAQIALARMLLDTGNEVGARARVSEVLSVNESHAEALKMQAAWQIDADETDEAIAGLRLALDQNADDARAMTLMSMAYDRAGRPELARDFMALAVEASGNAPAETIRYVQVLMNDESFLAAEDLLLNALRIAPRNLDLLLATGELYLRMDDRGRSEQVVRTLRGLEDSRATQAANRIEAELINRKSGTDEAIAYLEQLAGSTDASLASQIAVVRARLSTGDAEGAMALIRTLREEHPDEPVIKVVQASVEAANGNLDAAEDLYRQLVEDDPQVSGGIWLELAALKTRQEDPEAARAVLDEALTHLPDNPQLLWAKASQYERDGQIDDAIGIYENLYTQSSGSVIIANNLASLLSTYKDDAESLERAWVVARRFRDAEVPQMQDTYGWIVHRRGDSEEALPYLEAAAEGLARDPIVQFHLAEIYNALDRREDALRLYREAVDIAGPADQREQIIRAQEEIQKLQSLLEN